MGSIDKALPLAGFYPDSQNRCSDGAKIKTFSISSKYFGTFLMYIAFFSPILVFSQNFLYLCPCIVETARLSSVLCDGRNLSLMWVWTTLQDIAGQKLSIQNSDEVYIQIVGKTSLETRPLGIGIRLYRRTLSLCIVLGPVCRRLGCKYARNRGYAFFFP